MLLCLPEFFYIYRYAAWYTAHTQQISRERKGKVAQDRKVSALRDVAPAVCRPLCQGLKGSAGKRWPPSAGNGRGGSAWCGGFLRKVKGGGSRRPSGGVAWPPRLSSFPGRLHHQNLPPTPTPAHTRLAGLALTSARAGPAGRRG